ncbi:hypothetical protein C8J57DRAFT_1551336 [Mycena rebaudengoi]|nr:hypothetical protein C8J57DRAFT_1551336 [Mycena rebaudengoi]
MPPIPSAIPTLRPFATIHESQDDPMDNTLIRSRPRPHQVSTMVLLNPYQRREMEQLPSYRAYGRLAPAHPLLTELPRQLTYEILQAGAQAINRQWARGGGVDANPLVVTSPQAHFVGVSVDEEGHISHDFPATPQRNEWRMNTRCTPYQSVPSTLTSCLIIISFITLTTILLTRTSDRAMNLTIPRLFTKHPPIEAHPRDIGRELLNTVMQRNQRQPQDVLRIHHRIDEIPHPLPDNWIRVGWDVEVEQITYLEYLPDAEPPRRIGLGILPFQGGPRPPFDPNGGAGNIGANAVLETNRHVTNSQDCTTPNFSSRLILPAMVSPSPITVQVPIPSSPAPRPIAAPIPLRSGATILEQMEFASQSVTSSFDDFLEAHSKAPLNRSVRFPIVDRSFTAPPFENRSFPFSPLLPHPIDDDESAYEADYDTDDDDKENWSAPPDPQSPAAISDVVPVDPFHNRHEELSQRGGHIADLSTAITPLPHLNGLEYTTAELSTRSTNAPLPLPESMSTTMGTPIPRARVPLQLLEPSEEDDRIIYRTIQRGRPRARITDPIEDSSSDSLSLTSTSSDDIPPYDLELQYPESPVLHAQPAPLPIIEPQPRGTFQPLLNTLGTLARVARDTFSPLREPITPSASPLSLSPRRLPLDESMEARNLTPGRLMAIIPDPHTRNPQIFSVRLPTPNIDPKLLQVDELPSALFDRGRSASVPGIHIRSHSPHIHDDYDPMSRSFQSPIPWKDAENEMPSLLSSASDDLDDELNWEHMEESMMFNQDSNIASWQGFEPSTPSSFCSSFHLTPATIDRRWFSQKWPSLASCRPIREYNGAISFGRDPSTAFDFYRRLSEQPWDPEERAKAELIGFLLEWLLHMLGRINGRLDRLTLYNTFLANMDWTRSHHPFTALPALNFNEHELLIQPDYTALSTTPAVPTPSSVSSTDSLPSLVSNPSDSDASDEEYDFLTALYEEFVRQHPLTPIHRDRIPEGTPIATSGFEVATSSEYAEGYGVASASNDDESTPKRQKMTGSLPNFDSVAMRLCTAIRHWNLYLDDLRALLIDLYRFIGRACQVIEWGSLQDRFRQILFPDKRDAPPADSFVKTFLPHDMALYRAGNFYRTSYHTSGLLHPAEANFLQACAILFRQEEAWSLAFAIEELLTTGFFNDSDLFILRENGFLDNVDHFDTTDPETAYQRLSEVGDDFITSLLPPKSELVDEANQNLSQDSV